jgi:OOP family OmpA-OmpF porin
MSTQDPISTGRYRRRILGLGALALVLTFVLGAAIFIPVVQNDLEDRVEDELGGAEIDGVSASFSGQDGTLTCAAPLDDPEAASALAEGVHGVRVIDLDRSCSSGTSATVEDPPTAEATDPDPPETELPVTEPAATTPTTETVPASEPDLDGIVGIVNGDPLFSQLAGVLATAGLDGADALGGDGPFTLLAPTDAAFDAAFNALGADAFNVLASDPEALRTVLLHHATEGAISSSDFVVGDLEMLDGTSVAVDPGAAGGITFTSSGRASGVEDPATQLDIEASNGVVHAIDRLLIPDGLVLGDPAPEATTTTVSFAAGQITLSGVVQTEAQRTALVAAAQSDVDPANLIDELAVDADAEQDQADLDRFTAIVAAMPSNLVDGEASLAGAELTLTGTYLDDAAQAELADVGTAQDATLDLSARQAADADSAAALQTELNEFVRDNPILFEPNSATLAADANAIIDRLAARATRLEGTAITIVGHTDSDGKSTTNQTLSEQRAASVLDALVERGLDATTLTSDGRGSTEPISDESGAEEKAASRRVEFVVQAT